MLEKIARDVLSFLLKAHIPLRRDQDRLDKAESDRRTDMSRTQTSRPDLLTQSAEPRSNAPVHVEKQVGRNDPCPCGSGKNLNIVTVKTSKFLKKPMSYDLAIIGSGPAGYVGTSVRHSWA